MGTVQNIERLPRWARERIATLEMRVRELHAMVDTLYGDKETNTSWGWDREHYLPNGQQVEFRLPAHPDSPMRVSVRVDGKVLDINADSSIMVSPGAANHIQVLERP